MLRGWGRAKEKDTDMPVTSESSSNLRGIVYAMTVKKIGGLGISGI
jgi:hypothetical protein